MHTDPRLGVVLGWVRPSAASAVGSADGVGSTRGISPRSIDQMACLLYRSERVACMSGGWHGESEGRSAEPHVYVLWGMCGGKERCGETC